MIKIVTGFIPLIDSPKTVEKYAELGAKLLGVGHPIALCEQDGTAECWLYKYLEFTGIKPTCSVGDNTRKNTAGYHMVQHQKTLWMVHAAYRDPVPDVFVWIDFGIFGVPGITAAVIQEFLRKAEKEQGMSAPGCWAKGPIDDKNPCWRFCGGVLVCHRRYLFELDMAVRMEAMCHIRETNNVSWEVNTWARAEKAGLPLWWYPADHNETMFTNYPEPHHATV